jgi:hypothetical protein
MPLEDILGALDAEGKATVLAAIDAEKTKGINAKKSADTEAIKAKDKLKDLGWDSEKYENFDAFKDTIGKKVQAADDSEVTLAGLNDKINTLTTKLTVSEETSTAKTLKLSNKAITKKLTGAIGSKLYASEYIVDANVSKFTYDEDSDTVSPIEGTYDDNIKSILEANKENLKVEMVEGDEVVTNKTKPSGESDFVSQLKERMNQN